MTRTSHHLCAFLWEAASILTCNPRLMFNAQKHRRALMPSRQIPLCAYSWADHDHALAERINLQLQQSRVVLGHERRSA